MKYSSLFLTKFFLYLYSLRGFSAFDRFEIFSNDPDIDRNSSELIESRGFISQTHHVITEDGYVITIFRIINPYLEKSSKLYPIYIQHGFAQDSDGWLITDYGFIGNDGVYVENNNLVNNCSSINSYGRTLAFVLSACGFDVWIGNFRGTKYSSHLFLNPNKDTKFWSFNIDHFSAYDITATIQYILKTTESETIGYIGYSMGNAVMFQLLSTQTEYSKLIKPFIALAPFVYLSKITSILRIFGLIEPLLSSSLIPVIRFGPLLQLIGRYFCGNSLFKGICVLVVFLIGGFDYQELDFTLIPRLVTHSLNDEALLVMAHIGQRIDIGNFAYYDYGMERNLKVYGQTDPPNYNLSKIDSKYIVLMSGLKDILSDPTDVDELRSQLSVPLYEDYVIPHRLWSHSDFLYALNVGKYINARILRILDSFN